MKVVCKKCGKAFNIPDERLPMGDKISFPCPACKGVIDLDLTSQAAHTTEKTAGDANKNYLTGDALKRKILRNIMDLPPMPQTVIKARKIMSDKNSDFKQLANLFETDQAIATKILKLANSPYYGMSGKVSSIQHASVVLGYKTLGELITMGGASGLLNNKLEGYGLDGGALWKHSLAVAFGSKIIANKVEPSLVDDAFTAGLIHDAGKLILDKFIAERWELFEEFLKDKQNTFLTAEKKLLLLDHPEIAAEICVHWNIPKPLITGIKYHHYPSKSNGNRLAYIIHIADTIAMMTGLGLGVDGNLYKMEDKSLETLGFKEEDVNDIMGEMLEATKKISM